MPLNLIKFDYIVFALTYAVHDNPIVCMILLYALEFKIIFLTNLSSFINIMCFFCDTW